jgi:surface protein
MFRDARSFLGLGNIWQWNTRQVVSMNGVFMGAISFNANLNWITDLVNDMAHMFDGCISFRGDVSLFNTSRVQQMRVMFRNCSNFNSPIGSNGHSWQVGSVLNMTGMFDGATIFNQPINNWNTNSVTDMSFMFRNARNFNQNIGSWNTSRVTNMQHMFDGATAFNYGFPCRANSIQTGHNSFLFGRWFWDVRSLGVNGSNFMFNNATCFVTNINSWVVPINSGGIGFRRNSGLEDRFTPPNILNRAPNGGR